MTAYSERFTGFNLRGMSLVALTSEKRKKKKKKKKWKKKKRKKRGRKKRGVLHQNEKGDKSGKMYQMNHAYVPRHARTRTRTNSLIWYALTHPPT